MGKGKLLPVLIASPGLMLGSAALYAGDIKVYSHAQVEIASVDDGTNTATAVQDNARGRVGVSGSEDLGNGLTGIAMFEFKTDTADNTAGSGTSQASLTGREAHVGLKGGFGTLQLGTLKSPYKYSGGIKYDPFVTTFLEARANGAMTSGAYGHKSFLANSFSYQTPNINGFDGWVAYSLDESGNSNGDDGDYSLRVMYKQDMFEVFLAAVHNNTDQSPVEYDSVKVGGKIKFMKAHSVAGQFEMTESVSAGSVTTETDLWFLGYTFTMDKTTLVAQMGQTQPDTANTNDTDYYSLGAIYKFSKTYRVFGGYRSTDNDTVAGEQSVISVGLRMNFG